MKKSLQYIFLLLGLTFLSLKSTAQFTPNNENGPSTGGTANIAVLPSDYNQGVNTPPTLFNYTRTWLPAVPTADSLGFNKYCTTNYHQTTTYLNGWGSPLQTILRNINSTTDLANIFDNRLSSKNMSLLGYPVSEYSGFQTAPYTSQQTFYNTLYPNEGGYAFGLSESVPSDGTDIQNNYDAGLSFAGRSRGSSSYTIPSDGNDVIRIVELSTTGIPTVTGTYAPSQITQQVSSGQHGGQSVSYFNKSGQLICTKVYEGYSLPSAQGWQWTYYVYDELGRIRVEITPKAVNAIFGGNWTITQDILDGLCYQFTYNSYGQLIERKTPDKQDKEYIVYDQKYRPVLTQTPLMKHNGHWKFNVYDHRGRVVLTGVISSSLSRDDWQSGIASGFPQYGVGTLQYYLINEFEGNYPSNPYDIIACEIEQMNYYDYYDLDQDIAGRSFDYTNSSDLLQGQEIVSPDYSSNVDGLLTGSKIFIRTSQSLPKQWLSSVYFYDQHARRIQTHTLNPFQTGADWDVSTSQFDFSGHTVLNILSHHAWDAANKLATKIVTKYDYNLTNGQLRSVSQRIDNGGWRTLSAYQYDNLGRVNYKNVGLIEDQYFDYNIRGQLTGLNQDFVDDPNCAQCINKHYGENLSYDFGSNLNRYDGKIGSFTWRSSGFPDKRAYTYNYDEAGRLAQADFSEYSVPGFQVSGSPMWHNQYHDYSVSSLDYDANGNMLSMVQKGLDPATSQIVDIDELTYHYNSLSNSLDNVKDNVQTIFNLGDFNDYGNNSGADYTYDQNGNLTHDNNIGTYFNYNEKNQPETITALTGVIRNSYGADGTLLQKNIEYTNGTTDIYRYWGPFVYRNDSLLYVTNSEGRCRWLKDSSIFKYDYFLKDHLGNVRSTLTADEDGTRAYLATHEVASAQVEGAFFEKLYHDPKPNTTNPKDVKATDLDGSDASRRIGTSIMLKVMAGDQFNVSAENYYDPAVGDDNIAADGASMLRSIISTLVGGAGGITGSESHNTDLVNMAFTSDNYLNVYDAIKENVTDPHLPRAYLNYIVFDEDMHIIPDESGAIQVGAGAAGGGASWQTMQLPNDIKMTHNGYLAVYLSNEQYRHVFFDNVSLVYYRGRLLEEQHYYPHGLVIQDGTNNPIPNKFLYQGKELQEELGVNLYDFGARQYDAKLGRFWSIDPAGQFSSGYVGMGNDPANNIDPTGMVTQGSGTGVATDNYVSTHVGSIDFSWLKGLPKIGMRAFKNDDDTWGDEVSFEYVPGLNPFQGTSYSNYKVFSSDGGGSNVYDDNPKHPNEIGFYTPRSYSATMTPYEYNGFSNSVINSAGISDAWVSLGGAGNAGGEKSSWYETGGKYNASVATWGSVMEQIQGTFRVTRGAIYGGLTLRTFSPRYYPSGWIGGSRAAISTYKLAKAGHLLGQATFLVGVTMDGIGVYNFLYAPKSEIKVHPAKAVLNTGMAVFGLEGGAIPATLYFGIDAFWPGGWGGFAKDQDRLYQENRAIDPNYRSFPGALKQ